jgi:ribosomal protein S18 acetylase RimI-like enzyme
MRYLIKNITTKDIKNVVNLVNKTLSEDFPTYSHKTILAYQKIFNKKYFTKQIKDKNNIIFGVFNNNELIGFLNVLLQEYGGVAYIDWLAVKKGFRNEGIGSKLLNEADQWSLKNKCHYIFLNTETLSNIDYYKKRGYRYVGVHKNSWFGEDEHILGKNLCNKPFDEIF